LLERDQELERITASRATIEAAHARWKFLSSHLEHLTQLETFENGLNECRAKIAAIEREQIRLRLERSRLERTAIDTTRSLDQLYRQLEDRKTTRERLTQDLTVLRFVLPSLERFQRARTELIQTDAHIRRHKQSFDEIQSTIEKFRRDAPNEAIMTRVRVELDQLAQGLLRSEATLNELEQQLERLSTVAGSAKCKYCQQPLPDSHITQERAHLESERAGARASFQELHQKHAAIRAEADSLMDRKARCEQHRAKLEWQASSEHAALESATRLNAEYQRFCCDAYEELPVHHQVCIAPVTPADWSDTTYPANEDMNSLRESVLRAQSESKELDQSIARFQQQIATCLSMQTREASDGKSLDEQLDKLAKELSKLTAQQAEYQGSHDALRSALASLPEGSSMGEPRCTEPEPSARDETGALSRQPGPEASSQRKRWDWMRLRNEWARLSKEGLTERLESLQRALTERQTVAIQLMATRQQLATLPPDATRSTAEVAAMLQDARLKRDATERGLREATSQVARLEDAANRRDALADQHRAAERHEYLWNRLSSLLGPDFLQQHLLRRAQRAIVDYANAILDRLAAGQLYLELRDENDARSRRAFDLLSCTATANGTAQDVAFLSGSQEFRVAVSLSLAIGQYAGATRRPVRAVIIDEGFGCLDAVNRQVMIQELQNLRNHLELILLVSHQEEFASAFRDGYRCELVGGASRLIPFHR
jgi:DNA repair exonuclease SbcCD ATPase subunit